MTTLRAGLVGIGMMGRNHARVLREISGVELVGVADPAGDVHGVAGGGHTSSTPSRSWSPSVSTWRLSPPPRVSTSTRASSSPRPECRL